MSYHLYIIQKKNDTNELIYKTEIDSHTYNNIMVTKGEIVADRGW